MMEICYCQYHCKKLNSHTVVFFTFDKRWSAERHVMKRHSDFGWKCPDTVLKNLSSEIGVNLSVSLETGGQNQTAIELCVTQSEVRTLEQSEGKISVHKALAISHSSSYSTSSATSNSSSSSIKFKKKSDSTVVPVATSNDKKNTWNIIASYNTEEIDTYL
ncbi:unnamed protein product [Mytilus coruscus]|uniref:Uncharacterized protein n=1 Tax=Mytilus coruscus TaxID=42192 RepID=A0A6J8CCG9_MYTCO|nr:unnamed protein product [Mytilus coruscus]